MRIGRGEDGERREKGKGEGGKGGRKAKEGLRGKKECGKNYNTHQKTVYRSPSEETDKAQNNFKVTNLGNQSHACIYSQKSYLSRSPPSKHNMLVLSGAGSPQTLASLLDNSQKLYGTLSSSLHGTEVWNSKSCIYGLPYNLHARRQTETGGEGGIGTQHFFYLGTQAVDLFTHQPHNGCSSPIPGPRPWKPHLHIYTTACYHPHHNGMYNTSAAMFTQLSDVNFEALA
jgi:hypothetical protein